MYHIYSYILYLFKDESGSASKRVQTYKKGKERNDLKVSTSTENSHEEHSTPVIIMYYIRYSISS